MSKINDQGRKQIEVKIRKPLETMAQELEKNGSLSVAQPFLELVFETLFEIDKNWEKVD